MQYNLQLHPGLHIKIIKLMQAAGYDIDPKGVCFGIASMAAQAGLIPENQGLKDFLDRLHRINILYDAVIKQATQEVNEQAATTLPQKTLQKLIEEKFVLIVADIVNSGKDKKFFEGLCGNDYICDWDKKNVQLYKTEEYGSDQDPTDLAKHQENTQNQGKQTKSPELQVQEHSIDRSAPTSRIFIDSLQSLDAGNATNPGSKEIVKINCGSKYDLQAFFDGIALYQTSPIVKQILEIDQTPN